MANWDNLERDLELASMSVHSQLPDAALHIREMRAALREWPGLKLILLELIARDRYHMKAERERQQREGPVA